MTDEKIKFFCANVKLLKEQNGLNREEMAEICGIDVPDLIQIEQGYLPKNIKVDIAIRLFRYFNLSPEELFCPLSGE